MKSLGLFGISTSLSNDMDPGLVSYKFLTIVLLLVMDLAFLLPYTARMLYICSCGILLSCLWYTKQILVCPYFCSGLTGMLISSNPPSYRQWLDPSTDIGFPPVAGLLAEPLPVFETFVVVMGILSVVAVS
jgi:hypothetical protein